MNNRLAVDALVDFFEGLSPETVARFPEYYADDACTSRIPFNEVRGVLPIQHIFAHMFRQVANRVSSSSSESSPNAAPCWSGNSALPAPGAMGEGQAAGDPRRLAPQV
jgi:hypothetical protein